MYAWLGLTVKELVITHKIKVGTKWTQRNFKCSFFLWRFMKNSDSLHCDEMTWNFLRALTIWMTQNEKFLVVLKVFSPLQWMGLDAMFLLTSVSTWICPTHADRLQYMCMLQSKLVWLQLRKHGEIDFRHMYKVISFRVPLRWRVILWVTGICITLIHQLGYLGFTFLLTTFFGHVFTYPTTCIKITLKKRGLNTFWALIRQITDRPLNKQAKRHCLNDWLTDCLSEHLYVCLPVWLSAQLTVWLSVYLSVWLTACLPDHLTVWLTDCSTLSPVISYTVLDNIVSCKTFSPYSTQSSLILTALDHCSIRLVSYGP